MDGHLAHPESVIEFLRTRVVPTLGETQAVLLVGSHAEGNANRASDIDLVVIARSSPGRRFRMTERGAVAEGRHLGIITLTEAQARRQIRALDRIYADGRYLTNNVATRFRDAQIVCDPEGVGGALVALAREYEPVAATYREMLKVCLSFYEDTLGALRARDPETALLAARQSACVAVDCWLLQHGERSLKPKWRVRRLRRAGEEDILHRFLQVSGLADVRQADALQCLADLDRIVCSVFGVASLAEIDKSPIVNDGQVRRRESHVK